MKCIRLLVIGAGLLNALAAGALDTNELQSLRSEVLQLCRGGTLTGTKISTRAISDGQLVTLNGLLKGGSSEQIFVATEQWNGIAALANDPAHYTTCVDHTVSVLAPLIKNKQNIDVSLNARLSYIKSPVFCDRLVHVISQAPYEFMEWRNGAPVKSAWAIGPYLMANAAAIDMTANPASSLDNASVEVRSDGSINFNEPLIYTHRFQAEHETGLVMQQIVDSIDACLTPKRFYRVDKVRYRGGPYKTSRGSSYWSFDKTGQAASKTFDVFLSMLSASEMKLATNLIYLRVETPK